MKTKDSYNFATDDQIMVNVIKYIISKRSCTFFYGSKVNFIKALRSYSKTQFSFEKMKELISMNIEPIPKRVELKLPTLKKIELPKLKKIE